MWLRVSARARLREHDCDAKYTRQVPRTLYNQHAQTCGEYARTTLQICRFRIGGCKFAAFWKKGANLQVREKEKPYSAARVTPKGSANNADRDEAKVCSSDGFGQAQAL